MALYQERGYDRTTAAEIAERAGVTGRTFFRHFADKREVLFGGEAEFADALTSAVLTAPARLGPWETLLHAFRSLEPVFVENRSFSAPRQRVIAANPALQERAQSKSRANTAAVASALNQRGVPERLAGLAAQLGTAALNYAVMSWLESDSDDLDRYVVQAFEEVRALSSPPSGSVHEAQADIEE